MRSLDRLIECILQTLRAKRQPFTYRLHSTVGGRVSGVYAFWLGRACLYVGKSTDIGTRLYQHRMSEHNPKLQRYFHAWPRSIETSYAPLGDPSPRDLDRAEREAILHLRPRANVLHNY